MPPFRGRYVYHKRVTVSTAARAVYNAIRRFRALALDAIGYQDFGGEQ
jgi:hypothetical protein